MEVLSKAPHGILLILFIVMAIVTPIASFKDSPVLDEENEDLLEGELLLEESLLNAEDNDNSCCLREKRLKKVGISVTGEDLTIDVGHCRKRCPSKKLLKKKAFQRLLQENPDMDPVKLFLLHSPRRQRKPSCPRGQLCTGIDSRRETVMTSEGELSVDIVERCSCQRNPKLCRRQPKIEVFHKGTPLEVVVDVGECRGVCRQDTKCKPIVQKTTSIKGPNGAECVSVIDDCGCATDCYRISHYEQFYDYVDGLPSIRVVDIGKCIGECSQLRKDHCVLRGDESDECVVSLTESASECLPMSLLGNEIRDKDGTIRNITSISTCGCR